MLRRGRFWRGASLCIWAALGNMEVGSFSKDFARWMKGSVELQRLTLREFCEGEPGWRVILLGTLKDMLITALDLGVCFHRVRAFEEHEETFLS